MARCNFLRRIREQLQFNGIKPQKRNKFLNLLTRRPPREFLQPWNWDRSTIRWKVAKQCSNLYTCANLTTPKTMNSLRILIRMKDRNWKLIRMLLGRYQQQYLCPHPQKLSSIRHKAITLIWKIWEFPVTKSSKNKSKWKRSPVLSNRWWTCSLWW